MSKHSAACCTIPPVVTEGYKGKGKYIEADGLKCYTTGPSTAKTAILVIYDIFGYFPQTIQGADILAHADKEHQYQVFMPDFFDGKPADISWYPPDTKEKGEKLGNFFSTTAAPPKAVERLPKILKSIQSSSPNIESWGVVGFCWGGKIVSLTSGAGTPFKAGAQAHPAMVDAEDAKKVTIPMAMLASKDEPADDVKAFKENLSVKNHVETFSDQIHGWMAARGDLNDPKVKSEYERGYQALLTFFHEHLPESASSKI
ncbi:MAG: hydrolase 76 protein [Chaenotheca gracillima]|nr:MAG: hydrolase 76 protein [Chaenotheca gracillima]